MKPPNGDQCPWAIFQIRIRRAISIGTTHYIYPELFVCDLAGCIETLRDETEAIDELDNPMANEIAAALEEHAKADDIQFDELCAANIISEITSALAEVVFEPDA